MTFNSIKAALDETRAELMRLQAASLGAGEIDELKRKLLSAEADILSMSAKAEMEPPSHDRLSMIVVAVDTRKVTIGARNASSAQIRAAVNAVLESRIHSFHRGK